MPSSGHLQMSFNKALGWSTGKLCSFQPRQSWTGWLQSNLTGLTVRGCSLHQSCGNKLNSVTTPSILSCSSSSALWRRSPYKSHSGVYKMCGCLFFPSSCVSPSCHGMLRQVSPGSRSKLQAKCLWMLGSFSFFSWLPGGKVKRYLSTLDFGVLVEAPLWLVTAFLVICLGKEKQRNVSGD